MPWKQGRGFAVRSSSTVQLEHMPDARSSMGPEDMTVGSTDPVAALEWLMLS